MSTKLDGWAEKTWNADGIPARWHERDNPTNLTPAQAQAQQAIMDAARLNPDGIMPGDLRAECRTVKSGTESRDPSEAGGGAMTCAEWFFSGVIVISVIVLALLR